MRADFFAFIFLASLILSGCSANLAPPDEGDQAAADARLQKMLAEKEATKQRQEAFAQKQRQIEEDREAARIAEANRPHYSQPRLQSAAKPRNWASITVPDLNVKAVFNSTWTNDRLNYRVALLGQRVAIDTYLSHHDRFRVNFQDQGGNQLFDFPLNPEDFNWEPPGYNNGIPTMDTQGAVDMPLPVYEQSVQWNLTWDQ